MLPSGLRVEPFYCEPRCSICCLTSLSVPSNPQRDVIKTTVWRTVLASLRTLSKESYIIVHPNGFANVQPETSACLDHSAWLKHPCHLILPTAPLTLKDQRFRRDPSPTRLPPSVALLKFTVTKNFLMSSSVDALAIPLSLAVSSSYALCLLLGGCSPLLLQPRRLWFPSPIGSLVPFLPLPQVG